MFSSGQVLIDVHSRASLEFSCSCCWRMSAGDLSFEFVTAWLCVQTIKTWYKHAPEILGRKLAQRKQLGGVIPQKQREVKHSPYNTCVERATKLTAWGQAGFPCAQVALL